MATQSSSSNVSVKSNWTTADMPPQSGRSAIVTGTGGLGLEAALQLARAGAEVIIAGRNSSKGSDAVAKIRVEAPSAKVRFEKVDLASLASIREFGSRMRDQRDGLSILVNNAAVMTPPKREETSDGFELQFGTNYLSHFALTAQMMPLLRKVEDARVVTLSSVAAKSGEIRLDDLQSERTYKPMAAYSQSKLACLMFAFELQKRSAKERWGVSSLAAHPGVSRTDLLYNAPGRRSLQGLMRTYLWFLFQPVPQGALPTLYAATAVEAESGVYYGPSRLGETRGPVARASVPSQALEAVVSAKLWQKSQELTGETFVEPKVGRTGRT